MNIARQHHYVPRCYLRGFTRDKGKNSQLLAIDVTDRRHFWTSHKNVAQERDFNRVELPGQPIDVLEHQLGKFDSELGTALQTIGRDRTLDDENTLVVLLNFASVVAARNPYLRASMEAFHERMYRKMADMTANLPRYLERKMGELAKAGKLQGKESVTVERLREFIKGGQYDLEFPPGFHVVSEFGAQDVVLRTMAARNWILLRAPATSEFVTSDLPACLVATKPTNMPLGYGMPNTLVLLPVSSALMMVGSFDGPEGVADLSREMVAGFNTGIASNCNRWVFARSPAFETMDNHDALIVGEAFLSHMGTDSRREGGQRHMADE